MSYVLEGILVSQNESEVDRLIVDCPIEFDLVAVDDDVAILARPGRPQFDEAVCELAFEISKQLGEVLVVRWDDRIGLRESRIYRSGALVNYFSNDDELYVTLDDEGMPLRDGKKFKESELDEYENGEFEVYQNALELGCGNTTSFSWPALYGFIQRQG